MTTITLTIPELTPSLNQTLRQGHWSKHQRHRKHWSMLVLVAKSDAKIFAHVPAQKTRVVVERHGGRLLDRDNFFGGLKAIVDGLRDNGLIVNDDPDHISLHGEQHPGGKGSEKKTVVRIEPA